MTALVFTLEPNQICIAMDTLIVSIEDKMPLSFQRKFLSLANNNLLIAGTGSVDFINAWFKYVLSLSDLDDIEDLNTYASSVLQDSAEAAGGLDRHTATLYHLGYSKIQAKYVGYAYRSTANFKPEMMQYGLILKPVVHVEVPENVQHPGFLIDIVLEQQIQDRLHPLDQQVGIGGEIEFVKLVAGSSNIETVHRFASYDAEKRHIEFRENTSKH
jgi:hypothetical protein